MFWMPEGFYPLERISLLLALMVLARIPSLEALRYVAPGEWGKLIGLDRIPEVRTLRQKIMALCAEQAICASFTKSQAHANSMGTGCLNLERRSSFSQTYPP
jgi:hypothetical protein